MAELFKRLLVKLATRANIEIQFSKGEGSKEEQFARIRERIGEGNPVDYVYQVFNRMAEQQQPDEVS